ncbi:DUF4351 domain-containing protein [Haliangium sp.]|uniref:DUF4351 domain-containing protein n=1 Tax=Haliangium sp. TaxID=2663208 RepID=UPI003D10BBBD
MNAAEELRQEGRMEARQQMLLKQLTHRFGELPAAIVVRVHSAGVDELDAWLERILVAATLEDVFAAAT